MVVDESKHFQVIDVVLLNKKMFNPICCLKKEWIYVNTDTIDAIDSYAF